MHTGSTGVIKISRYYYTCENKECDYSCIPLDKILDISPNFASGKFESKICALSAEMPFENVAHYLKSQDNILVSETMIRNTTERCGGALIKAESQNLIVENSKEDKIETKILYSQIDGCMVPIQSDGEDGSKEGHIVYKECKLGTIYRNEDIKETTRQRNREKPSHQITTKQYVSSIGKGVEDFEKKWVSKIKNYYLALEYVFLSDGAVWIDNMISRHFPNAIHILDWYHALEHLWTCAKILFGENEKSKQESFVKPLEKLMWNGEIDLLCKKILDYIKLYPGKETDLRELYSYYYTRKKQMQYKFFREKGYAIGSGGIESANKYLVQKRLKGSGMKWTIQGAEAILKIREKIYEYSWELIFGNKALHFSY